MLHIAHVLTLCTYTWINPSQVSLGNTVKLSYKSVSQIIVRIMQLVMKLKQIIIICSLGNTAPVFLIQQVNSVNHNIYDPCVDVECHNGGSCWSIFVTGEYYTECQCADGHTGQDCSSDIDECSENDLCKNGAECTNFPGSFHCNCTSGFTGDHCQININICTNITCHNDNCIPTPDDSV